MARCERTEEETGSTKQRERLWIRSITNHLYWVPSTTLEGEDEDVRWEKWLSVFRHVQNIHVGHGDHFCQCEHGERQKRSLRPGYVDSLLDEVTSRVEVGEMPHHEDVEDVPPPLCHQFIHPEKDVAVQSLLTRFTRN